MDLMCSVEMLGIDNARQYLKKNHDNNQDRELFNKLFGGDWHFTSSIDPDVRIGRYVSDPIGEEEARDLGYFIQRCCGYPVLEVRITHAHTIIEIDPDGITEEMANLAFPVIMA